MTQLTIEQKIEKARMSGSKEGSENKQAVFRELEDLKQQVMLLRDKVDQFDDIKTTIREIRDSLDTVVERVVALETA